MNLDWRRLKALVFESDDWGLCAWSPDEQAMRVLADTPAFRSEAGRRYGASTLESAGDVRQLAATLLEFRGGDGFPPVWQANTVMAAPAFERIRPPQFEADPLPLADPAEASPRWRREGLWEAVGEACASGLWWPELHGLHHVPEAAWLGALRRGVADARRALEQHSTVCEAVEASGEYDPSEPRELRRQHLQRAVDRFVERFGRPPGSLCPPDYRWDASLEADAASIGVTILQGYAEQAGRHLVRLRRLLLRYRWPNRRGALFHVPPRIAFEPCMAPIESARTVVRATRAAVRDAWGRGQPAIVSTHRANYAHLRADHPAAGRAALRDLLKGLVQDGAVFLTDAEVRQLQDRGWSVREVGRRGAIVRYYGAPRERIRFPAPEGVTGATVREGRGRGDTEVQIDGGQAVARLNVGEYLVEWEPRGGGARRSGLAPPAVQSSEVS